MTVMQSAGVEDAWRVLSLYLAGRRMSFTHRYWNPWPSRVVLGRGNEKSLSVRIVTVIIALVTLQYCISTPTSYLRNLTLKGTTVPSSCTDMYSNLLNMKWTTCRLHELS